jgi:hypothetical protein
MSLTQSLTPISKVAKSIEFVFNKGNSLSIKFCVLNPLRDGLATSSVLIPTSVKCLARIVGQCSLVFEVPVQMVYESPKAIYLRGCFSF